MRLHQGYSKLRYDCFNPRICKRCDLQLVPINSCPPGFNPRICKRCDFGSRVTDNGNSGGCLCLVMNVIWIFIGGFWICLTHLFFGLLLCITIIGIPFGRQHFKMAALALSPFGKNIV